MENCKGVLAFLEGIQAKNVTTTLSDADVAALGQLNPSSA